MRQRPPRWPGRQSKESIRVRELSVNIAWYLNRMGGSAAGEQDLPVREGQVLDGKFRVERLVGEGAMGLVVEATHLGLDERVALKFLRREARSQPDIVARFAREARAAVKLKSDHVARVFDVGGTEDGTPFIVMEFLEGSDLATILEVRRRLEIPEALEYVIQACEGLTEAHAKGIVHRDIKPENLFLAQGAGALKQIKVLDFGISKATLGSLEADAAASQTTQIMGSPHYMSPDQLRSTKDVDGRADIWSLGVVLFELITGHTPFPATDVTQLIAQILHEPHLRLTSLRSDAPQELDAIVDKCLAKEPAQRYQSPADLAIALLPYAPKRARAVVERAADIARSAGGSSVVADLDSIPPPATSRRERPTPSTLPQVTTALPSSPPRTTGGVVWVVAGLLLLVGVGAGLFAILGSGSKPSVAGPSTAGGTGWASVPSDTPVSDVQPTTAATTSTGATVQPTAAPSPPRPRGFVAPPSTASAPTPRPPPMRTPESEIRMER